MRYGWILMAVAGVATIAGCPGGCQPQPSGPWKLMDPPADLGDAIPLDIAMSASGEGWIVGLTLEEILGAPKDIFEGQDVIEGEIVPPAAPETRGLILRRSGGAWTRITPPELGTNWTLHAAAALPGGGAWLAGGDMTVVPELGEIEGDLELEGLFEFEGFFAKQVEEAALKAASTFGGVALRAETSGASTPNSDPLATPLVAVAAIDGQNAWCATSSELLRLNNGAWAAESFPPGILSVSGLAFVAAENGWAVGSNSDQGAAVQRLDSAWTAATLPAIAGQWELLGACMPSADEAWAVGRSTAETTHRHTPVLLHWTAGAWTSAAAPVLDASWYLESVAFPSPSEGWAAGTDLTNNRGVILHFANGQWTSETLPNAVSPDWALTGIAFASATEGWATGYDNRNAHMLLFQYAP